MKARKLERAVMLQEQSALRKRNIGEYFVDFTKHHRPWLKELAQKYKERGEFPLMAMVLLPSYYTDVRDKEIAVFAGLLISDVETNGRTTFDKVSAFRKMLGESPWEWFVQRKFVSLSIGKNLHKRTGCVENWKIAKLMGRLWDNCHITDEDSPAINFGIPTKSIEDMVSVISKIQQCSYFDVLTYLLEDCSVGNYEYKLRLLLQILICSDGFSFGLWSVDPSGLKCPLTHEIRLFVETWFPDYRRYGSIDDAIRLFGVGETDFFYAWLGYKELQKRNPKGCSIYATRYRSWYECGFKAKPYRWHKIMPNIPF